MMAIMGTNDPNPKTDPVTPTTGVPKDPGKEHPVKPAPSTKQDGQKAGDNFPLSGPSTQYDQNTKR